MCETCFSFGRHGVHLISIKVGDVAPVFPLHMIILDFLQVLLACWISTTWSAQCVQLGKLRFVKQFMKRDEAQNIYLNMSFFPNNHIYFLFILLPLRFQVWDAIFKHQAAYAESWISINAYLKWRNLCFNMEKWKGKSYSIPSEQELVGVLELLQNIFLYSFVEGLAYSANQLYPCFILLHSHRGCSSKSPVIPELGLQ